MPGTYSGQGRLFKRFLIVATYIYEVKKDYEYFLSSKQSILIDSLKEVTEIVYFATKVCLSTPLW